MRRPQIAGRVTVQRSTLSLCFIKPERLVGTGASNCRNLWTYYNPVCLPVVLWCARFYRLPSDGQCRCHAYRHPSLYVSRNSRQWFVLHSVACIHGTPCLSCPTIISIAWCLCSHSWCVLRVYTCSRPSATVLRYSCSSARSQPRQQNRYQAWNAAWSHQPSVSSWIF